MGHSDLRTTRRYDRDRHNLDRDPSHAVYEDRQPAAARTRAVVRLLLEVG